MLITFAIPRTIDGKDYAPDTAADLPADIAGQLVRDGYARRGDDTKGKAAAKRAAEKAAAEAAAEKAAADNLPEPPPRSGKGSGVDKWVDYASAHKVAVPESSTREEIVELLDKAGVPTGPPADPDNDPGEGDNKEKE